MVLLGDELAVKIDLINSFICMFVFHGIVSYCLHIHTKDIKKKHRVSRYEASRKINHRFGSLSLVI